MNPDPPPSRILLIRPSALGDVCRTVPVLVSLAQAYPEAMIDWVVQEDFLTAIEGHPALHQAIVFPRKTFGRWWRNPRIARDLLRWFISVRRTRYDLVLDCQGLGRSGLISLITGARHRVCLRSAREFAWLGSNDRVPAPNLPPTVDQVVVLFGPLGLCQVYYLTLFVLLYYPPWWSECRRQSDFGDQPYVVVAPTSRWPSKRWPIERFEIMINQLPSRGYRHIVLIGAPGEESQATTLHAERDHARGYIHNLIGKTSIGQTMAILEHADLVVANDSAPLHMAVGFDRPCVGLFGPTNPARVGPYGRPETVVRSERPEPNLANHYKDSRLGDSLMRLIEVDDVLTQIDKELSNRKRATARHDPLVEESSS